MLEAVGFEQSRSRETESGTLPVRDPRKSQSPGGGGGSSESEGFRSAASTTDRC